MFKKSIVLAIFLGLLISNIPLVYGQGLVPTASGPTTPGCTAPAGSDMSDATYCGNYGINDFVSLAINVSKWILGIVGSLTLIMFIYGGFLFLISGGGSEKIAQAQKILVAAVIGLIIVFSSYLIIQFVLGSMGLSWTGSIGRPKVN